MEDSGPSNGNGRFEDPDPCKEIGSALPCLTYTGLVDFWGQWDWHKLFECLGYDPWYLH